MPQYKIGESVFNVEDSRVDEFLNIAKQNNDIPELVEDTPITDPGKKKTPKQSDANEESATTASNTDSFSGAGSLDYGKQTVVKPIETEEEDEDFIEPYVVSIKGTSYTKSEIEAGAIKFGETYESYLSKFSSNDIEILRDPEQLEEVVVTAKSKSKYLDEYQRINSVATKAAIDKKGLSEARAKIYFGDLSITSSDYMQFGGTATSAVVPTSDFAKNEILKNKLGDKYQLYQEYIRNGEFKLPNANADSNLTIEAQREIKGKVFEQELGKFSEQDQRRLKAFAGQTLQFKSPQEANDYFEGQEIEIKRRVSFIKQSEKAIINSQEFKDFINKTKNLKSQLAIREMQIADGNANEETARMYNSLVEEFNTLIKDSNVLSDINALSTMQTLALKNVEEADKQLKQYTKDYDDSVLFKSKADLDYRFLSRIGKSLGQVVPDVMATAELISGIAPYILSAPNAIQYGLLTTQNKTNAVSNAIKLARLNIEKKLPNIPEATTLLEKVADQSSSIAMSLTGAGSAAIISKGATAASATAAAKIGQNVTLGLFFSTGAGQSYGQAKKEQDMAADVISSLESKLTTTTLNSEKEEIYREIARQKEIQNYGTLRLAAPALLSGAYETVYEGFSFGLIGKSATKNLFSLSGKNAISETLKGLARIGKETIVINNGQELATQVSNTLTSNIFSAFDNNPKYLSLDNGINKDFFLVNTFTAFGMTTATSAPHLHNQFAAAARGRRDKKIFFDLANKYNSLKSELSGLNPVSDKRDIKRIKDRLAQLEEQSAKYNLYVASKLDNLSPERLEKVFAIHKERQEIAAEIVSIQRSGAKLQEAKTKEKLEKLNKEIEDLDNSVQIVFDEQLSEVKAGKNIWGRNLNTAKEKLKARKSYTAEQIFAIAEHDYGIAILENKLGQENVAVIESGIAADELQEKLDKFLPDYSKKSPEQKAELVKMFLEGNINALEENGKAIVNNIAFEKLLIQDEKGYDLFGSSVSPIHELFHGYTGKAIEMADPNVLEKVFNELTQNIENNFKSGLISKEAYEFISDRIKANTNNVTDKNLLYEEIAASYNEAIGLGYITSNDLENKSYEFKSLIDSIRLFTLGNSAITQKTGINTSQDIINHLRSFNKFKTSIKTISQRDREKIKQKLSQLSDNYSSKIQELEDKLLSGELSYDEYDSRLLALEQQSKQEAVKKEKEKREKTIKINESQKALNDKVDKLVGAKDSAGNYTITQKEWLDRGIKPAYDAIILGSLIDPLITRGIQGDNVYGKPIDQFVDDVKNGLADLLVRFNPESNNSLIGFINSQLRFRKLDVLNKYKKESGTSSIDIEAGEVGSIQELMSNEDAEFEIFKSEQIAQEKNDKAKPRLSDTVVLSDAVKEKLDSSTVKAIALNIKKFDEEISKNRTITPFVADLKKDISNLMEADMIQYIRSYGYEQFLKDTRESYLLNLPTSILSKHPVFRAGIQKRVNGKWLAPTKVGKEKYDWVDESGKKLKIDRDNAAEGRGLTSGPEFIRRNPDIVNVVTENMYVDYHFMDGPNRRTSKQNPLSSIARQMASEIAIENIQQDLKEDGTLTSEIKQRAEVAGLFLTEEDLTMLDKNFERGLIKFSQVAYTNASILAKEGVITDIYDLLMPMQTLLNTVYTDPKTYINTYEIRNLFNDLFNNVYNKSQKSDITKEAFKSFKAAVMVRTRAAIKYIIEKELDSNSTSQKIINDILFLLAEKTSLKKTLELEKSGVSPEGYKGYANSIFEYIYELELSKNNLTEAAATPEQIVAAIADAWTLLAPVISKKDKKGNNYENAKDFYEKFLSEFAKNVGIKNGLVFDDKNNTITYNGKNIKNLSPIWNSLNGNFIQQTAKAVGVKRKNISVGMNPMAIISNLADRDIQAAAYRNKFAYIVSELAEDIKNKEAGFKNQRGAWLLYVFLQMSKGDMAAMLKVAFDLEYVIIDPKTFVANETPLVYEHTTPVNEVAIDVTKLVKEFINGNITTKENLLEEIKNLISNKKVSLTQKSINDALRNSGVNELSNIFEDNKRYLTDVMIKSFPDALIMNVKTGEVISFKDYENSPKKFKLSQVSSLDSKGTNSYFNEMLERKKGIAASESISKVTAKLEGRGKGRFEVFVPPSAEDFEGMLYYFMGAGEQGEIDRLFFEDKLLTPIAEANYQLNYERQVLKKKFALLLKSNKGILKRLREESNYKFYTIDSAVRVYIWDKLRFDIPGLYDKDIIELVKIVENNPVLKKFADQMVRFPRKQESWQIPTENWAASTLEYDLQQTLDKVGRKRIFAKFIENKKIIFSEDNLNKVEAAYGSNFRSALEDMLYRIENGKARESGKDRIANAYMNWVRGSVAVTMFLNTRSALLQQLSMVNFSNWEENNPLAQAKAFANTKQWASDWAMLWNSDWMKERREGLKTDINESELITAMESSRDKTKALLHWVLTQGFSLTKYGDNFAIATGGAAYYRNRVNKYLNEGLEVSEAEKKAFLDFQEIAERTQQSSRQDLLSNQQVSVAGRLFLAFQNTPMQMTRLTKKAVLDLVNNRGSRKANISKILYYSAIQNMIFAFFQNALFAITGLDDEDEEDEKLIDSKTERAINNILDSVLRGSGVAGGTIATVKNVLIQVKKQEEAGWKGDGAYILLEAANVAPPVGIKARRFYGAYKNYKINKNIIDKVPYSNLNHPLYGIAGSLSGAAFNVPLDRLLSKANNVVEASNADHEAWQRIALFLGYTPYDLGIQDDELARIRKQVKEDKKKSNKKIGNGKPFGVSPVRVKPKRVN